MYKKILIAVDLSNESGTVVSRAVELSGGNPENLALVHAIEPIPTVWGVEGYVASPSNLQDLIVQGAKKELSELGTQFGISAENQHTILGSAAAEIRNLAEELGVDAIVIGSHGHSGWKLMLGATANKLLHGSTCDVLTVHVKESN